MIVIFLTLPRSVIPNRGAAEIGVTAFLLKFYYIRCRYIVIFNQEGVPPNYFKGLKDAANQKRLKDTDLGITGNA